jgi:hypothetical protein
VAVYSRQVRTSWTSRRPAQPTGACALAAPYVGVAAAKGATARNQIDEA